MSHRIALLFEYSTLNGGERSMLQVIDCCDPAAFTFIAIGPPKGRLRQAFDARHIEYLPLLFFDPAGGRLPRETLEPSLTKVLTNAAPDLVHANSLSMGRLTGAVSDRFRFPCAAHLRDIISLSAAAVSDLNRNQALLAVSDATRRFHLGQGVDAARTRVLHNGVDCQRFRPRPQTGYLAAELSIKGPHFIVMTVGQIGLRKGLDVLAEAAPAVASTLPQVEFVVVGERNSTKAESIEFERRIERVFRQFGLADRLHRLGYRDDVAQLMNEADLLAHPAKQEPLGRVLLEAAAAGLPIVATEVGGTPEILTDGESARLVPAGDPQALAEGLQELALDEVKRNRMADAARRRVVQSFDAATAASRLAAVWSDLIG